MKINPIIEQKFLLRPDGLYQEQILHFVEFQYPDGRVEKKLDKRIFGRVFKEDNQRNSLNGIVEHVFEDGTKRRLVALSNFQQG